MGMYTRLSLNVVLRPETPRDFIEELLRMVDGAGTGEGRRKWMLASCSYYHGNINYRSLEEDKIGERLIGWQFSVTCDLKNYEGEIEWFLEWLAPHVATEDFAGYTRYEEDREPTLIWFRGGEVLRVRQTITAEEALANAANSPLERGL